MLHAIVWRPLPVLYGVIASAVARRVPEIGSLPAWRAARVDPVRVLRRPL